MESYYQRNAEAIKAKAKEYYKAHRAERNEYSKRYYQEHKEEIAEWRKEWNKANRYDYGKAYYHRHPEKWKKYLIKRCKGIEADDTLRRYAQRLKDYRILRKISQGTIGYRIGKTQQYVSMIERMELPFNPDAFAAMPNLVAYVTKTEDEQ